MNYLNNFSVKSGIEVGARSKLETTKFEIVKPVAAKHDITEPDLLGVAALVISL